MEEFKSYLWELLKLQRDLHAHGYLMKIKELYDGVTMLEVDFDQIEIEEDEGQTIS